MWKKTVEAGHIIFVTIDGDPFAGKQIRGGYYDCSVVQDALAYGDVLVQMLDGYIFSGKEVPVGEYTLADTWFGTYEVQEDERGRHEVIPPYYIDSRIWRARSNWWNVWTPCRAAAHWGLPGTCRFRSASKRGVCGFPSTSCLPLNQTMCCCRKPIRRVRVYNQRHP